MEAFLTLMESPFLVALGLVFFAELGDKTQLIALAMAARYRMRTVLLGAVIGTVLVTGFSVGIGLTIGQVIAEHWLEIGTGLLLIVFALLMFRGEERDDEGDSAGGPVARFGPVIGIAAVFFLAEIGDKTMLATVGLAAQTNHYLPVWLGASAGMIGANVIGIVIGRVAGARLPEKVIRWAAAAVFFISGVVILLSGVTALRR